jgi:hypothetical protein
MEIPPQQQPDPPNYPNLEARGLRLSVAADGTLDVGLEKLVDKSIRRIVRSRKVNLFGALPLTAEKAVSSRRQPPGSDFRTAHRIKEGKQAVALTRLSCYRFRANEVRLWLSLIAHNLGNLWRRLVLPTQVATWSLTSLQQHSEAPAVDR